MNPIGASSHHGGGIATHHKNYFSTSIVIGTLALSVIGALLLFSNNGLAKGTMGFSPEAARVAFFVKDYRGTAVIFIVATTGVIAILVAGQKKTTQEALMNENEEKKTINSAPSSSNNYIVAPMVGKLFLNSKGGVPFVQVGDLVNEQTIVGKIEVMKMEIILRAGKCGRITKILTTDNAHLERGETLFVLD